jgi:hypothetical protein
MKQLAMAKLYISQVSRIFKPIARVLAVLSLLGIKNRPKQVKDLNFIAQFAQGELMNAGGFPNDAKAGLSIR